MNVHTIFDIPIQIRVCENLIRAGMEDVFEGADVELVLNVKEGAIYPSVMRVNKNGVPSNPFADFDDCEEV